MIHSSIDPQTQANIRVLDKIDDFFNRFKITSASHRCGIRKRRGHNVRSLTMTILTLPFVGKNRLRGIVINDELAIGKDAAYELLRGSTSNWRRLQRSQNIIYGDGLVIDKNLTHQNLLFDTLICIYFKRHRIFFLHNL
jgi:hypothetical protein